MGLDLVALLDPASGLAGLGEGEPVLGMKQLGNYEYPAYA